MSQDLMTLPRPERPQDEDAEELALKHDMFESLHSLVDATLQGMGIARGITPSDETISVKLPPDSTRDCKWEYCDLTGFSLAANKVVNVVISVSPWRLGRNRGRKREEVAIDLTWVDRKRSTAEREILMERKVILTAAKDDGYRDLWIALPELKLRWSLFHGFVKYDLGGVFVPVGLPTRVSEEGQAMIEYSMTMTVKGLIENLGKLSELNTGTAFGAESAIHSIISGGP